MSRAESDESTPPKKQQTATLDELWLSVISGERNTEPCRFQRENTPPCKEEANNDSKYTVYKKQAADGVCGFWCVNFLDH